MANKRLLITYEILIMAILYSEAVKIGISKPLPLTTTMAPNTTVMDSTTEDINTETTKTSTTITNTTPRATTLIVKPTTSESEWPEFPPKKSPITTSTTTTTTKKSPTTTTIPTSTTSTPKVEINETTSKNLPDISEIPIPIKPKQQKFCFCDLTQDSCDINCCCDRDCSEEALKVFRCEVQKPMESEELEGRFEDFKFQHGLPSCEVNDGWLCVFRTNPPVLKEELSHSFEDTSRYNKWPNFLLESEDIKSHEFYKFGDTLRIINIYTKEIQNFDLPSSFQSSSCRIKESIYHLKSVKKSCSLSTYEELKEIQLGLQQLQDNYKIFIRPNIPDDLYNQKNLNNYIGNITVKQTFKNEEISNNHLKVKVNIFHNFTNIQEVAVVLYLNNIKNNDQGDNYWFSYETEFFNKTYEEYNNQRRRKQFKPPLPISGALGYLTGKPLILGRYEPYNKTKPLSDKNQVINYFSIKNNDSHILALFTKESGECKRFNPAKDHIKYGINTAKYCKIKLENSTLMSEEEPHKMNFTEICLNLQKHIHDQLFGQDLEIKDLSSYLISQLGKPENNSNKWLPLQVFNSDFDPVVGQYLHESNTFVCRNILLSLTYEFHMATFMVDNVPLQNVIQHAVLHLSERHDLEFALDENLEVPITVTVRFYHVHEKAVSASSKFWNFNLLFEVFVGLVLVLNI